MYSRIQRGDNPPEEGTKKKAWRLCNQNYTGSQHILLSNGTDSIMRKSCNNTVEDHKFLMNQLRDILCTYMNYFYYTGHSI